MLNPIILTDSELLEVTRRVDPHGRTNGAWRISMFLGTSGGALTVRVNTECAVGNISDVVSKAINPAIQDMGLYVACTKPPYKILNKFGKTSSMMIWGFFRDAANQQTFDLEPDLKMLTDEYPDLEDLDGSSPEQWGTALKKVGVKR